MIFSRVFARKTGGLLSTRLRGEGSISPACMQSCSFLVCERSAVRPPTMKLMTINAPIPLLQELAACEMELIVLDHPDWLPNYPPLPTNCVKIPFATRTKLDFSAIRQLRQLVREHRPDILHPFLPKPLANAVLATTGLAAPPRIVSFRGISTVPSRFDPANYLTYYSRKVDFHACESQAVQEALVRGGIAAEHCQVVYNCVPLPSPKPNRDLLESFNIPRDAFVIGTVATIRPVKRIDLLLEAAWACSDLDHVYFLLVGPVHDPLVKKQLADPRSQARVRHLGFREDASQLAGLMDLFVMPSKQEALCRALLEAMSHGVCPVVSAAGGMPELVRDGIDGCVFPIGDGPQLTAKLRHLHADRRRVAEFGAAARKRVAEVCSPAKMCERTVSIYRRLAG